MRTCCIIGKRNLIEKEIKRAEKELLETFEYLIANNFTHFIVGAKSETDVLAAEILASLKAKNKNIILELAIKNDTEFCFSRNEIKFLFLEEKINLIHEVNERNCYPAKKECYKYMINSSDVVVAVWDKVIDSDIDKKLNYAKLQNKEIFNIFMQK